MFEHKFEPTIERSVAFHWFLLSFGGGAINAGGFLATGRFVSHVTGFATLFGVDVANSQWEAAVAILSVPLFFLLGAFVAGLLIDRPLNEGREPRFDWVMGLSAVALVLAAVGDRIFSLGLFGQILDLRNTYVLLALLCLACGLQNAAITSSSGKSVRTTHLTGLTTDLGIGLARVFSFDLKQERLRLEVRANYLRIGSVAAFVFGSAAGAWIFVNYGFVGFMMPALIATYAAFVGRRSSKKKITGRA